MASRSILFLITVLLHFGSNLKAQSIPPSGGELTYEYIGDSSGIPHHYAVNLIIYKRADSSAQTIMSGVVSSSCFSSQTLSFKSYRPNLAASHGGVPIGADANCGDTLGPDSLDLFAYYYGDTVILQGICTNFRFTYSECCRDSAIANINLPESAPMLLTAILNNVHGPNTSPQFIDQPRYKFCKGQAAFGLFNTIEPDGDSLFSRFKAAHFTYGNPVNYLAGYSSSHPLDTSWTSFIGAFVFNPKTAGIYTVVYELLEYRYDSTVASWISISKSIREINYTVSDSCPNYLINNFGKGLIIRDTLYAHCNDSTVSFKTNLVNNKYLTFGSEFRIVGPDFVLRPVVGVNSYPKTSSLVDSLTLLLHKPLIINGVFTLYNKELYLVNPCGNVYPTDPAYIVVSDCNTTSADEPNVEQSLSIYPNPTRKSITLQTGEHLPETITLFDMQGKELKSIKPNSAKSEVDISEYSSGVYLLKVEVGGQKVVRLIRKI